MSDTVVQMRLWESIKENTYLTIPEAMALIWVLLLPSSSLTGTFTPEQFIAILIVIPAVQVFTKTAFSLGIESFLRGWVETGKLVCEQFGRVTVYFTKDEDFSSVARAGMLFPAMMGVKRVVIVPEKFGYRYVGFGNVILDGLVLSSRESLEEVVKKLKRDVEFDPEVGLLSGILTALTVFLLSLSGMKSVPALRTTSLVTSFVIIRLIEERIGSLRVELPFRAKMNDERFKQFF